MIKTRSALIVDPDFRFLKSLKEDPRAPEAPPFTARTGKEAQLILADPANLIAGVFINPAVITPEGGPDAVSAIRFSKQRRSSVPVYLICDEKQTHALDLVRLGIRETIQKPITLAAIMQMISPEIMFDKASALSKGANQDQLGAEISGEDAEFIPIRAADFVSGSKVFFDVYIRLGSGRYVKLIQTGDAFTPERLDGYIEKGVQNFYLRKDQQHAYLTYCNEISKAALKSKNIANSVKLSQVFNSGEETMKFLKGQGLSENRMQYASSFVSNVHNLVESMDLMSDPSFSSFANDVASYEHSVSTSMIASLIADEMEIQSDSVVQIVGISSLMHDIGLFSLPQELHDEDESKMSDAQRELFQTHPALGADILRKMHGINPSVIQAVLHHHERRNKKGFSTQGKVKQVNRVAEIVGISDDFAKLISKRKKQEEKFEEDKKAGIQTPESELPIDPLIEMQQSSFDGFSSAVVDAFRAVFMPKG